jgi:soluble lytic murein transglycosylase
MSSRMTAIGQPYGLPNVDSARRQVSCPANPADNAPASASSVSTHAAGSMPAPKD